MSTVRNHSGERQKGVIKVASIEELGRKLRALNRTIMEVVVEDMSFKARKFKRHMNGDGSVGGFVETTALVHGSVFLGEKVLVLDSALLTDDVRITDFATVAGRARIWGGARVREMAYVGGDAVVEGEADVAGAARIFQNARVRDNARIFGDALIFGEAEACGKVVIAWHTQLNGKTVASGEMLRTA